MKEIKSLIVKILANNDTLLQLKGKIPYDFVKDLLISLIIKYEDATVIFEEE